MSRASPVAPVVKDLPANAGATGDSGSVPGLGRAPGGGKDNALQYSCLGNPIVRGAWCPWSHKESDMTEWLKTHTFSV